MRNAKIGDAILTAAHFNLIAKKVIVGSFIRKPQIQGCKGNTITVKNPACTGVQLTGIPRRLNIGKIARDYALVIINSAIQSKGPITIWNTHTR